MKNYYLIVAEHFIGLAYLLLFFYGFFTDKELLTNIGGIGTVLFIYIMVKGQAKNLISLIMFSVIFSIIAYFINHWWYGLYWAGAFFSIGQVFGLVALLKVDKEQLRNQNLINFGMTGMKSDPDKLGLIEILFFIGLIVGPYLLSNNLIDNNTDNITTSLEEEIKEQIMHMEKSKEYSNQGIQIMNLDNSQVVSQNKIDSYKEFLKKSIEEAKKVDTSVLNKIKSGYGTIYYEKYLIAKELELQGFETGNASSLTKGQILYDEFVEWMNKNMTNPN